MVDSDATAGTGFNNECGREVREIAHAVPRLNDGRLLMKDYDTLVKSLVRENFSISPHYVDRLLRPGAGEVPAARRKRTRNQ